MSAKFIRKCSILSFGLLLTYILFVLCNPMFSKFAQEGALLILMFFKGSFVVTSSTADGYLPQQLVLILVMLIPTAMQLFMAKKADFPTLKRNTISAMIVGCGYFAIYLFRWVWGIACSFYVQFAMTSLPSVGYGSGYYDRFEKLIRIDAFVNRLCSIFSLMIGILLFVVCLMSLSRAVDKRLQRKLDMAKLVVAIMILLPELLYLVHLLLSQLSYKPGVIRLLLAFTNMNQEMLLLIAAVSAIIILIFGVFKVKSGEVDYIDATEIIQIHVENYID